MGSFLTPVPRLRPVVVRGIAAAIIFVGFGLLVARTSGMTAADLSISTALNAVHTGTIGGITSGIYAIFGPAPAIVITIVAAAVIWMLTRNWRPAITFGVVVAVTWLPAALVKALVHRPRPEAALLAHPFSSQPTDASYPSGHIAFVTALVVALFMLTRGRRGQAVVGVLGGLVVAGVALALVIDGVHYPSDVLASIVWSLGLAPLVLELWNRLIIARIRRTRRTDRTDSVDRTVEVSA
jgi:membrane-associated phospholipid phosphatase